VGENHTIILERKRLVDFEQSLEDDLRASKADYEAGRYLGPFDTAEDDDQSTQGVERPPDRSNREA
jgi:hypothetical protein